MESGVRRLGEGGSSMYECAGGAGGREMVSVAMLR
jgi:hypothetical protein